MQRPGLKRGPGGELSAFRAGRRGPARPSERQALVADSRNQAVVAKACSPSIEWTRRLLETPPAGGIDSRTLLRDILARGGDSVLTQAVVALYRCSFAVKHIYFELDHAILKEHNSEPRCRQNDVRKVVKPWPKEPKPLRVRAQWQETLANRAALPLSSGHRCLPLGNKLW